MKALTTPVGPTILLGALAGLGSAQVEAPLTAAAPMVRGDTAATGYGWKATPIFTVGETIGTYQPVGIPDGIYAFAHGPGSATALVNHELPSSTGYAYSLKNGTQLTGSRVSFFGLKRSIDALGTPVLTLQRAGMAYDTVYDRAYQEVTSPAQINETGVGINGFDRFCSSNGVAAGTYGFVDNVYLCGEETGKPSHPHGGTQWAIDVRGRDIWAVPAMGRGGWEVVTALDPGIPGKVALLLGDDTEGAPLYLYVGDKDAFGDQSFLDRNGLKSGRLYAWKADSGDLTPEQFKGLGASRSGSFVEITVQDLGQAGTAGYDAAGYADHDTMQAQADALGCFSFARPEDVDTNPHDGTQAAFNSTGRGSLFPSDNWGDIYVVDVDFEMLAADVLIVHDADGLLVPDLGIRSPDNLDWGTDGKIYVTEDRATTPSSLFGAASGVEASLWRLDPITKKTQRIAEIDRSAVPAGMTDPSPADIGNWETSGVVDVTALFETLPGERLLLVDVQAHSVQDGAIGGNPLLDEGGQLVLLSKIGE